MRFGAISRLLTLTLFAAATSLAAHAGTTTFTFTPDAGDLGYSFSIPADATYYAYAGSSTAYTGEVELSFTDPSLAPGDFLAYVGFYNASYAPNIPLTGPPAYDMVVVDPNIAAYFYVGPQLYTGAEADPIFTDGTFQIVGVSGQPDGSLTITTSTPEPSSIALLGTGVLAVAGTVRRKFPRNG